MLLSVTVLILINPMKQTKLDSSKWFFFIIAISKGVATEYWTFFALTRFFIEFTRVLLASL